MHKLKKLLSALLIILAIATFANAQTLLPQGFNEVLVAPGITMPTTMAVAPDGRFFIAQQTGALRVVKNGAILTQPFITLAVNTDGERGLLGVAFDPSFTSNQYVYLCYTIASGDFNRVSRFTASGDTVVPGSEVVLIDLDTLIANYHGGGHLHFGPDGKLYISAGENGRPLMSQNLDSYLGKILRINSDGTTPSDNPFPGTTKRKNVWAYGLRNPFTFDFQPGTGRFFIDDVGDTTWEEINDATIGGANFGWPGAEGYSTDTAYRNPFYYYHHGTNDSMGCSITGGTFFNPDTTNYPSAYLNRYYFIDYCGNWINSISLDSIPVWSHFATNIANYSVGITTGLDGNLYFLSRNDEALYKITYTPDSAPLVVNQPQSQTISLGFPVTFTATASGLPVLSYQWRKDTVLIPGAVNNSYTIPAVAFSDSGDYNMIVSNPYGSDTSINAHLTVTGNQPPHAVIDTPLANTLYSGGDVIYFHGFATDPEDGVLPDSVFSWVVVFHHNTHIHPGPTAGSGISSGTFTIPNIGEVSANVWYRLFLIVHDSQGALDTDSVDIRPRTTTFIIASQPQGLSLTLDGQPFTAPDTVLGVEGIIRNIAAPYSQMAGPSNMLFTHWSNTGSLSQTFPTPTNDTVFTAFYDTASLVYSLGNDTAICTGTSIILDAGANYTDYVWTDGSVNRYLFVQSAVPDTLTFGVTITDSTGAVGNDSVNVIFDICNGIATAQQETIRVYPVPSAGEITISGMRQNYFLTVVDITGRVIIGNHLIKAQKQETINLPAGIYSFSMLSIDSRTLFNTRTVVIK